MLLNSKRIQEHFFHMRRCHAYDVTGRLNIQRALFLFYMRYVLSHIPYDYNRKDIIYAYASQIYHDAGMYDSAYIYAKKLIKSHNNNYRKNGYTMLLSPELREFTSPDSLLSYSLAYREVLDEFLNKHDAEQLVTQTSLYNYERQESARLKAEKSMKLYMLIAGVATFCILILIIIALYFRNRSIRNLLQYHEALQDISILRESLASELLRLPMSFFDTKLRGDRCDGHRFCLIDCRSVPDPLPLLRWGVDFVSFAME